MFKSLFKCFFLSLFLRYEIINELLRCSQPFFVIIMYILHIIVLTKILTRRHSRSFLKSNSPESWKCIWKNMRHLRSCYISWTQTLIFVLKRVIWFSCALDIKRLLKNIHGSSYEHLVVSNCFLFLSYHLLAEVAIIWMHKRLVSISIFWNFNVYFI